MKICSDVAYRFYKISPINKAILFHLKRRKYMFLEGLSATLFMMLLSCTKDDVTAWGIENDITSEDIDAFCHVLDEFGCFGGCNGSLNNTEKNIDKLAEEDMGNRLLNKLQDDLYNNDLIYSFHIDLTNRCNERCIHCYHPFDSYDYGKELTTIDIKLLIDLIYDLGVFSVTLSGGEALLKKDFFEILSYISDKGMMVTLFTNGLLLSEDVIIELKKYRLNLVSISIYGDTSDVHDRITTIPGSFDRTMNGVDLLRKHGVRFELKCVVLSENIDRVDEIRALSRNKNYGADCKIDFGLCGRIDGNCSPYIYKPTTEAIRKVFYSDPKRYMGTQVQLHRDVNEAPCGAGKYGLYCDPYGDIYPCVSFRLLFCHFTELSSITQNETRKKWLDTKISDFSECFKHDYCNYCTEQCAGNNLIENGDYLNSNVTHCERAKIIAEWYSQHQDKI